MKNKRIVIIAGIILALCLVCAIVALLSPDTEPTAPIPTQPRPAAKTPVPSPTFMTVWTSTPATQSAQYYVDTYGGSLNAYIEILSMTDCAALQEKFEIAYANSQREEPGTVQHRWTIGFMTATDDRMKAIACY